MFEKNLVLCWKQIGDLLSLIALVPFKVYIKYTVINQFYSFIHSFSRIIKPSLLPVKGTGSFSDRRLLSFSSRLCLSCLFL